MMRCFLLTAATMVCLAQPAYASGSLRMDTQPSSEVSPVSPAQSPQQNSKESQTEFVWELDPYYSEVSLHFPLTDEPIPEMSGTNEYEVYKKLLMDSLVPRFMLIEAAVFPMPLVGVAIKEYQRDFYRGFNIGSGNLNLLETVTAGFQEPYAISVFVGDMVSFVKPGEEKVCSNKGYMGYMLSYSNQHIKRNTLIPDHNFEAEWKMKGERVFHEDKLSWSFRIGSKIHENPNISNTLYLGFRRSNLDFTADFLSFMNNGSIDFRWDFSAKDGRLLRQEYVVGKKFPIKAWHLALRMDVGLIWEDPAKYRGPLRDNDFQTLTAVLRPNIEF
ncbi:MAG: hypothetical protein RW306_12970 [Geobacteraceae bacterium]|nr:hypothetical protein [Geobacteraceae bacterium]